MADETPEAGTPRLDAPDHACVDANSAIPCPHVQAAQALLTDKLGYTPKAHRHLHWFVHTYTLDDLALLYDWKLAIGDKPHFRKVSVACSPENEDDVAIARQWQAAQHDQAVKKAHRDAPCDHPEAALRQHADLGYWYCTIAKCGARLPTAEALARGLDVPAYLRTEVVPGAGVDDRGG